MTTSRSDRREWKVNYFVGPGHGGGTGYYYIGTDYEDDLNANTPGQVVELLPGDVILSREEASELFTALDAFNRPAWFFDNEWRGKEDAQRLYRAIQLLQRAMKGAGDAEG